MAYTKNTNFTAKDALSTGNPAKVIKGSEFDTEFDEIATESAKAAEVAASNTFTGNNTFQGTDTHSGACTFSGANTHSGADTHTGVKDFTGSTLAGASPLVFEGATADDFETTLVITDPTADRTITVKDESGTVAFTSDIVHKISYYQATSTSDDSLTAGDNNAASFGTVVIPTAGTIKLMFTGRINETSTSANRFGWGVKIGASYFYAKFDDNGAVATGSSLQTANLTITGSEYRILYGAVCADNGAVDANIVAYLDIEALGITTGSNTVEFGIDVVGGADLKGTLVTSRFYMTIEDYT